MHEVEGLYCKSIFYLKKDKFTDRKNDYGLNLHTLGLHRGLRGNSPMGFGPRRWRGKPDMGLADLVAHAKSRQRRALGLRRHRPTMALERALEVNGSRSSLERGHGRDAGGAHDEATA